MAKPQDVQCYHCRHLHMPINSRDHTVPCNFPGCPTPNTHAHCCHAGTVSAQEDGTA